MYLSVTVSIRESGGYLTASVDGYVVYCGSNIETALKAISEFLAVKVTQ